MFASPVVRTQMAAITRLTTEVTMVKTPAILTMFRCMTLKQNRQGAGERHHREQ